MPSTDRSPKPTRWGHRVFLRDFYASWYALADVEPFYRFDHDTVDPLRVGGGIGYVLNHRLQLQFIHHTQFTRPSNGGGLEYTDEIFRLNIKIGLLCFVKTPSDLCEAWLHCSQMPNGTSMMNPAATEMSRNGTATSQTTVTIG